MPTEIEALEYSHQSGLWGFQFAAAPNQQAEPPIQKMVMRAAVPPWLGRQWTVTLNGYRYSTGAPLLGNAQPTENQTTAVSPRYVRVEWGTSNATEYALIDYPARGCSFSVLASDLSVYLVPRATNVTPPILSGFITPTGRSNAFVGDATFTPFEFLLQPSPVLNVTTIPVPNRAIAYRWGLQAPPAVAGQVVVEQMNSNGGGDSVGYDRAGRSGRDHTGAAAGKPRRVHHAHVNIAIRPLDK